MIYKINGKVVGETEYELEAQRHVDTFKAMVTRTSFDEEQMSPVMELLDPRKYQAIQPPEPKLPE